MEELPSDELIEEKAKLDEAIRDAIDLITQARSIIISATFEDKSLEAQKLGDLEYIEKYTKATKLYVFLNREMFPHNR